MRQLSVRETVIVAIHTYLIAWARFYVILEHLVGVEEEFHRDQDRMRQWPEKHGEVLAEDKLVFLTAIEVNHAQLAEDDESHNHVYR